MSLLASFLSVLFHSLVLIGMSVAVGGLIFLLAVLLPLAKNNSDAQNAIKHSLLILVWGSALLAVAQILGLLMEPWALADESGVWPIAAFFSTGFAHAGMIHVAFAVALTISGVWLIKQPASRVAWSAAIAAAISLMVSGAWLVHAVGRLESTVPLMVMTVLHQLGAAIWVGGIIHLLGLWRLTRRSASPLWPRALARFSPLAVLGVVSLTLCGIYLWWSFIGDWEGLIGTAYGVMVLTKVALLLAALALGAMNFFLTRRWLRLGDTQGIGTRVPPFVEAEFNIVIIILLVAAALTSLPPSIDVTAEKATPAEVWSALKPGIPRLIPPPRQEYLASSTSSFDVFALQNDFDKRQSEFNHNVSGLLVLIVGLAALLDRTGKFPWARNWPLLFLLVGVFLVLVGEPNGWPLGYEGFWETMVIPSVIQHRLATAVVIGLALFEWRVRIGGLAETRWRYAFPVLCITGGALLLTHSHTLLTIKYQFLIEVSHSLLGFLAVMMGVGRLLELRLPSPANRLPGWLWAISLVLTGFVLLFYREF
ncbi:MAG TPA: CopD family protein [Burkholderiales bacterium]|nr:CopD family protein [Burkholderiales bacterium]